jgi:hypothetical protein
MECKNSLELRRSEVAPVHHAGDLQASGRTGRVKLAHRSVTPKHSISIPKHTFFLSG